jgi:hypothetical protein
MRRCLPDATLVMVLLALPLLMFWQQTLGGRTLIPTENLYQYEPYATYREVVRAPDRAAQSPRLGLGAAELPVEALPAQPNGHR